MAEHDSSPKDPFQKYLDAGIAFTNLTRARAEKLVSELVQAGEFRGDTRARVDELIERSRKNQEALFAQVRHEVDRQLEHLGITSLEDLATQVAGLIGRTAEAGRAATAKAAKKKASPTKATKKKAPTSAGARSKSTAQTAAKKAAAKKSRAKTSAATKATKAKKHPPAKAAKKSGPGRAAPGTAG